MLFYLEPSIEITGGPWFNENELDLEFIDELCKVCHRYIASKSFSTKMDHIKPVKFSGFTNLEQKSQVAEKQPKRN